MKNTLVSCWHKWFSGQLKPKGASCYDWSRIGSYTKYDGFISSVFEGNRKYDFFFFFNNVDLHEGGDKCLQLDAHRAGNLQFQSWDTGTGINVIPNGTLGCLTGSFFLFPPTFFNSK